MTPIGMLIPLIISAGCESGTTADADPRPVERRSKYLDEHPQPVSKALLKKGRNAPGGRR